MTLVYTPYIIPLLVAVLLTAVVLVYVWPRRQVAGGQALFLISVTILVWSGGYVLELMSPTIEGKVFWAQVQYIGIALSPYFWLWFALTYTGQLHTRPWYKTFLYGLALFPIITILLAISNSRHHLLWAVLSLTEFGELTQLAVEYGAWFWVHFLASYIFLLSGTIILLRGLWTQKGLYRGQVVALMVAILVPWVSNILFFANLSPLPGIDLTPFAFAITSIALTWALFGYQLIDISPIARELVVEGMREGVIVINVQGRIVDLNPAGARLIGLPQGQGIGQAADEVLAPWPVLLAQWHEGQEARGELIAGQMRYGFQIAPLLGPNEQLLGQIITTRMRGAADELLEGVGANTAVSTPSPRTLPTPSTPAPHTEPNWRQRISDVFFPAPLEDVTPLTGESVVLAQLLERAFTIMLRLAALLSLVTIVVLTIGLYQDLVTVVPFLLLGTGTAVLALLGFNRTIKFSYRTHAFLFILSLITLTELLNYGYSAEAFLFAFTTIIFTFILRDRRFSTYAFIVATLVILLIGVQIALQNFHPFALPLEQIPPPESLRKLLAPLLLWFIMTTAVAIIITVLVQSVNKAWWLETQAKNLVQQERDTLDQRVLERTEALRNREAILDAVAYGTTALLQNNDWQDSIQPILIKLGETTHVSRSYLFQKHLDAGNQVYVVSQRYEWAAAGIQAQMANPDVQELLLDGHPWAEEFGHGRAINTLITDLPPDDLRQLLESQDILSLLLVPIMVQDDWWGFLGFDDCHTPRIWSSSELEALTVVTNNLGAAIQRQQQAEKLAQTADQLTQAQVIGQMGNWEIDLHTNHVTWSDEHYHLFGLEAQSTIPTRELFRTFIHPEDQPHADAAMQETLDGAPYNLEYRIFHPDGHIHHMHSWAELIHDDDGKAIRLVGVIQDITRRKETEAALAAYAEQLAKARDEALEASQYKSLLLSKVSHELRTPLSGIIGYAELLNDEFAEELPEDSQLLLQRIVQNGHHLNSLIDDLLDQAQIEQGTIHLDPAPLSVTKLHQFLTDLLTPQAAAKELTLTMTTDPAMPPYLVADEKRLRQIVINLVNNALKFTHHGGVHVTFAPVSNSHWQIIVQDTGIGIAPEYQQKIFDSFWQADRAAKGYGLGLAIVYQLVNLMGGRVWVESVVGTGSSFKVLLPLETA